ncbi:BTAD domain-containing putative transcriptional regulator [Acuticoccus kandeliae]|uniref:BTAD domain-containing putative transcriptional regulator n=1 Tax=Acuticoccus kandeliae TaxID=2073160 RepID=UPI001474B8CC|nr:BTAD domain-containing putative transcriptional regulator [Acuticoccus kandeliae]
MPLSLNLFGGFRLSSGPRPPLPLPDRSKAVLAFVAVTDGPVPRHTLSDLLSDTGTESQRAAALRQALYLVRKATGAPGLLVAEGAGVRLDHALIDVDVTAFRAALADGGCEALGKAAALYGGPFLDGVAAPSEAFEEWLCAERAAHLEAAVAALTGLARCDAEAGDLPSALTHARRALALDPLHEEAHRLAIEVLAGMGQRTGALRQYETLRRSLADELGVTPGADCEALRRSLSAPNDVPPPSPPQIPGLAGDEAGGFATAQLITPERRWLLAVAAVLVLALAIGRGFIADPPIMTARTDPAATVMVRPFDVLGDADASFGPSIAVELRAFLSRSLNVRVVAPDAAGSPGGAPGAGRPRFVVEGTVSDNGNGKVVTASLVETSGRTVVWTGRIGVRPSEQAEDVAGAIGSHLVGFRGAIAAEMQRAAWRAPSGGTAEDAILRGEQFYFRFDPAGQDMARTIWEHAAQRFPRSVLLQVRLAGVYRNRVEAGWSNDPARDLKAAWMHAQRAAALPNQTRREEWETHRILAKVAQWARHDFPLSVVHARLAVDLSPDEPFALSDLSEAMANAGHPDEAVAWSQKAVRAAPGVAWMRRDLAWAYHLAGREADALRELDAMENPPPFLLAAVHDRLGDRRRAEAVIASMDPEARAKAVAAEQRRPLADPVARRWHAELEALGVSLAPGAMAHASEAEVADSRPGP